MGLRGSKQPEAQVLLLGLDNAGKSTLLYKLKHNTCVTTVPTIGFNVEMLEARRTGKTSYSCGERMEEARKELEKTLGSEQLRGRPLVLLANKQDVNGALTVTEIKDTFNLRKICSGRDWFVQPCSASTGFGVEEAFRRVVQMVK
ncbi:ADP-ribosylation factor-like protein 14 [Dissostichus eleginoides]|uniref:ADP-ribosylation factor-like protein 14 n=1 Tax=Dissostichus eleginoides TaxID=100907 RepID=A0AAD9EWK3_DISEL|nr:ADP-ribosylation factor-like protein 14 [Dissostichus eleginoides]